MVRSVIMMKVESKVWFLSRNPPGLLIVSFSWRLKNLFFYFLESKATALRCTPGTNHLPLKGLLSWLNCVDQVNHQKSIIVFVWLHQKKWTDHYCVGLMQHHWYLFDHLLQPNITKQTKQCLATTHHTTSSSLSILWAMQNDHHK